MLMRILRGSLTAAILLLPQVAAAEPQTLDAFSVWDLEGQTLATGEQQLTFVGALGGRLFVETPQGPLDSGAMTCVGTLEINLHDGSQKGSGHCTLTAEQGDQVFSDWNCSGYHLVGCKGDFKLTGGTGSFKGVKGHGPILFRASRQALMPSASGAAAHAAVGIAYWKGLTLELASQ